VAVRKVALKVIWLCGIAAQPDEKTSSIARPEAKKKMASFFHYSRAATTRNEREKTYGTWF
jgi:hypothetical protein